jgi:hypothetical protein
MAPPASFHNSKLFRREVLSPTPNIPLVDQGLHFWPLPVDLAAWVVPSGPQTPASISLRVIGEQKPLRDRAAVFDEVSPIIKKLNYYSSSYASLTECNV